MGTFEISVDRFNEFASEFAERFMNIDSYITHFEKFCDFHESNEPKILELGCGPGNVTKFLKNRFENSQITAIDLAPKMIQIAKQTIMGVDFRIMDVRNINSFQTQFDSIMCSFCLPFLSKSDTYKLISDCSEKLYKNGVLYISTMEGDESKAGFETTSFTGESKIYFNYHKNLDLEKAFLENGFSIEYNVRQKYYEPNGDITIDLIMIGRKK